MSETINPPAAAGIGHNSARLPLTMAESRAYLIESCTALIKRSNELVDGADRFVEQNSVEVLGVAGEPPVRTLTITNDEVQKKASDYIKVCDAFDRIAKERFVEEKAPFLNGGREVDAFFAALRAKVNAAKRIVLTPMNAYAIAEEDRKRKIAEDEAALRIAEANLAAQEAARTMAPDAIDVAARASGQADTAIKLAQAKPAEHSRVRSDFGAVSSLKTTWRFEETDKMALLRAIVGTADTPPRLDLFHLVMIDGPAVNRMIAGGKCRHLPGLNIIEQKGVQVR